MAEGSGLLNRRRDKISTEGSNPSLSAIVVRLNGHPEYLCERFPSLDSHLSPRRSGNACLRFPHLLIPKNPYVS